MSKEAKQYLKDNEIKNVIYGISCENGVIDLAYILEHYHKEKMLEHYQIELAGRPIDANLHQFKPLNEIEVKDPKQIKPDLK